MLRRTLISAALATTLAIGIAAPAQAQTEIQWWHSMTGGLNDWVVDLANGFNASQKEYKVVPTYKGSYDESMTASIAAFRAGNAPAHPAGVRSRHCNDDGGQGRNRARSAR